jgi:dihydrofolate reductase
MRKIRIFEHVSLDGEISPGDRGEYSTEFAHGGWTAPYRNPEGAAMVLEAQGTSFDLLLGRNTYDLWASYWPQAGNFPMANRLNAATKNVATHLPDGLTWGPVGHLGTDVMAGIRRLKTQYGPDLIAWGSATLAAELMRQGMVDELVLIVYPVLLGRGLRFFAEDAAPCELSLISSQATPTGLHFNTYRCVGPMRTA